MLDALDAYKKDYNVSTAVNKVIESLNKKLKKIVNEQKTSNLSKSNRSQSWKR